jgi:SNF2 family DNA or RNA helicase
MRWLDPNYWKKHGLTSYFAFRQTFALFKTQRAAAGHQYQQLQEYRNLDYLQKLIAEHSSRVLKEDVLDLPPKVYSKIEFDLAPAQQKIYDDIVNDLAAEIDSEHRLEAVTALVRLTRLQQITSGYIVVNELPPPAVGDLVILTCDGYSIHGEITELGPAGAGKVLGRRVVGNDATSDNWCEPFLLPEPRMVRLVPANQKTLDIFKKPGDNPRLRALDAILEPITHKVIIWARYRKDIDAICEMLGERAVRYDGIVGTRDREIALDRFRNDPQIQYFVANPQTLSMGVTLTQAKTVIYYSNTFQLEKRLQSEDRAHRIGQDCSVNIIDLCARDTVDSHIIKSLRTKFDLAAQVTGDRLREWIR